MMMMMTSGEYIYILSRIYQQLEIISMFSLNDESVFSISIFSSFSVSFAPLRPRHSYLASLHPCRNIHLSQNSSLSVDRPFQLSHEYFFEIHQLLIETKYKTIIHDILFFFSIVNYLSSDYRCFFGYFLDLIHIQTFLQLFDKIRSNR